MKYRQYKIAHFSEMEDEQFGWAWLVQARVEGKHPDCDVSFMFSDMYIQSGLPEYFIAPYDNVVIDELEAYALCGEKWSPNTEDWMVEKECTIVDGIPIITHRYCGNLPNEQKKSNDGHSRIVSWMPLFQLIQEETSPLHHGTDPETGIDYFECGAVKGYVSPAAKKELDKEVNSSDFKVAMVSINGSEPKPWLLYSSPKSPLSIRRNLLQKCADALLKIGEWRQAFPWAKRAMDESLEEMAKTFKEDYGTLKKDPEDNPEAGICCDTFVETNIQHFLPAIKNLLIIFDIAINDIDGCHAVDNYEDEVRSIKRIVDKMIEDLDLP